MPALTTVPTAPSPFGTCTFSTSFGGLVVTDNLYRPHTELPLHRHRDPYLCIVLDGAYEEATPSRRLALDAGALVGHEAGSAHANRFPAIGGRCLNVTPTGSWRENGLWQGWCDGGGVQAAPREAFLRLRQELACAGQFGDLGVAAALFELLHRAQRESAAGAVPAWLRRVRERIEDGSSSPSLAELAGDAGVHPSHLARAFRQWQGKSIGQYVRERRLRIALDGLAQGSMPMAELALAAGFADQAHMARAVRQATGHTPRGYRAAVRGLFKNV